MVTQDTIGSAVSNVQQAQQPIPHIPDEVRSYLEEVIVQAKLPVFDDETKKQLVQELFIRLDKFLALKIVENLSPEDVETFAKMNTEKKPQEEIDAFIAEHIPDADLMFEQAFVDFRDFYLTAQSNFEEVAKAGNPQ